MTDVNVIHPSTLHRHENTSTLLNHFLSIKIRINQLFYQVIMVRLVRAMIQLLAYSGALATLVHCSKKDTKAITNQKPLLKYQFNIMNEYEYE